MVDRIFTAEELQGYLNNSQTDKVLELFAWLSEQYQMQEARLNALLDTVNEAVCIIDEADNVVVWNHRAETLYGIAADKILDKQIEPFFSNLMLSTVMKEHRLVSDQYHTPCTDKHVLINARPVTKNDQVVGAVCCERDITELINLNKKLSKTHQEVQSLKQEIDKIHAQSDCFASIYGHSRAINEAISIAKRVAATHVPVMLRGESGTGKELFARAIHEASQFAGPFIAINCGAIPVSLFESELFGYQSGAFTGADKKGKIGLLEKANGGTLLLDEIGDMPKDMQVKLLRALQEKAFYRVGGNRLIRCDVRIIAATHQNLEEMIRCGDFREDLYYRLNVVTISLPSLRERLDDIPELVHKGIQYYSSVYEKKISKINPELMAALIRYPWPGNIRELYNVLERLVILSESEQLGSDNLPQNLSQVLLSETAVQQIGNENDLTQATTNLEKVVIAQTLREENYNKAAAAKKLGIPRTTLYYKMKRLGLQDSV